MKRFINKVSILCLLLVAFSVFTAPVMASHFRFGHVTWQDRSDVAPNTVDFQLTVAYRRSAFGNPNIGQTFRPGAFRFGDGHSSNFNYEVIALNVQEDWIVGRAITSDGTGVVRHTYPGPKNSNSNPWLATFASCCRIGGLRNSSNSSFRVETTIDLTHGNSSPISSLPPIVTCPRGACRFFVPAVDIDGDRLRWRLATSSESAIRSNPANLTIDADTGFVDWKGSSSSGLGLYAFQIIIEDLDENGNVKSKVAIDFIIKHQEFSNNEPPSFDVPPTPVANSVITAIVGQEITIPIQATDPDIGDQVVIGHVGIPNGATFDSSSSINIGQGFFRWTPSISDIGEHLVTFTANDNKGSAALPHSIVIDVIQPAISDVRVIDKVSTVDINIDASSFSTPPYSVEVFDSYSLIEWRFASFNVGQIESLSVDLVLDNLMPGEQRLVSHQVDLQYKDVNGNLVTTALGEQQVAVALSFFDIEVTTDRTSYQANEVVDISSLVSNLSQFDAATNVDISIRDSSGNTVTTITTLLAFELTASEVKALDSLQFLTGNTYIGSYQVYASLLNNNGDIVAEAIAPFDIVLTPGAEVSAQVNTDKISYAPNETVVIQDRIQNPASNADLDNLIAKTSMHAADGALFWSAETVLPQIGAQGLHDVAYNVPLGQAVPGSYLVSLSVEDLDGTVRATSSTELEVESTHLTGAGLTGAIIATPNPVFKTEWQDLTISVINNGNSVVEDLPTTLSIVDLDNQLVLAEWPQAPLSLDINAEHSFSETWFANVSVSNGYVAILTTELAGEDIILATQPLAVAEKLISSQGIEGLGRLLVLLDANGSTGTACKGLSQIDVVFRPEDILLPQDQIDVQLYDVEGALLDSETLTVVDFGGAINSNSATTTDLVLTNATADHIGIRLQSAQTGISLNGKPHRLEITHWHMGDPSLHDSGLIGTDCADINVDQELSGVLSVESILGVDETDPFSSEQAPTKVTQRRFLETLLENAGWSYTIVDNAEDYARELRSGGYEVTALFNEQLKIPESLQQEIVNAVEQGMGLLYAGYHDKRNGRIEEALGIKTKGKLPKVTGVQLHQSVLQETSETLGFNFTDKPLSVDLQGADSLAVYRSDRGDFGPAITDYVFGDGQSVYMGFDVLLQAAIEGMESVYADLITAALNHVHPDNLSLNIGRVVPITLGLENLGMAVSGKVILNLPAGFTVIDPGLGRVQADGTLLWPFTLASNNTKDWSFWLRLPEIAGAFDLEGSITIATENGQIIDYGSVLLTIDVTD